MSESVTYFTKMSDGKLIPLEEHLKASFNAKSFHVLDHGKEFLVVDHPNIITKREYEAMQDLFEEPKKRSMNGVC